MSKRYRDLNDVSHRMGEQHYVETFFILYWHARKRAIIFATRHRAKILAYHYKSTVPVHSEYTLPVSMSDHQSSYIICPEQMKLTKITVWQLINCTQIVLVSNIRSNLTYSIPNGSVCSLSCEKHVLVVLFDFVSGRCLGCEIGAATFDHQSYWCR